jgi:hypothetical protein
MIEDLILSIEMRRVVTVLFLLVGGSLFFVGITNRDVKGNFDSLPVILGLLCLCVGIIMALTLGV